MSNSIHQPQDKLFKQAMSDPRVAIEFFQHHLPAHIQSLVDFSSLQFHKETFIDQQLKLSAADVVYSVNIQNQPGYLYLLVEQQTKVDPWLPLRLMRYLLRLLEHHHKQYPQAAALPVVYPLIFYNGSRPYTASTDFFELFGQQTALAKTIYSSPFQLVDVQKISDEELRRHFWSGIVEFVYKHRYERNFLIYAETVLRWIQALEEAQGSDYAESLMHYIFSQMECKDIQSLLQLSQQHLSPRLERESMTIAEQLKAMGYQEGILEGIQQGLQQVQEEKKLIAKRLLERNMEIDSIAELTGLKVEQIQALQAVESF